MAVRALVLCPVCDAITVVLCVTVVTVWSLLHVFVVAILSPEAEAKKEKQKDVIKISKTVILRIIDTLFVL